MTTNIFMNGWVFESRDILSGDVVHLSSFELRKLVKLPWQQTMPGVQDAAKRELAARKARVANRKAEQAALA